MLKNHCTLGYVGESMKKFRNGLYAILNSTDPGSPDYRIARFLIHKVPEVGSLSISDIAEGSFVSKASVSRFCRRIGYANFQSMSQTMRKSQTYRYRRYDEYVPLEYGDEALDLYLMQLSHTIEAVAAYATRERLDHISDLIMHYEKIGILGQMHSLPIAMNMQMELSTIERFASCPLIQPDQERYILEARADTLVIVISSTGKFFEYFQNRPNFTSSDRPHLVLITANVNLKVCPPYDEVYVVPCGDNAASRPIGTQIFTNLVVMNLIRRFYGAATEEDEDLLDSYAE